MDAIEQLRTYLEGRELVEPGQQTRLAAHLSERSGKRVTQQQVWQWLNRIRPIPPAHARGIEEWTEGRITVHAIAPKVFGVGEQRTAAG
jgi:DNA-binding transcriptional regulator YdaS (Cro superfamily)